MYLGLVLPIHRRIQVINQCMVPGSTFFKISPAARPPESTQLDPSIPRGGLTVSRLGSWQSALANLG